MELLNHNEVPSLLFGEHIVWQGKPNDGLLLRPIEVFLVPFSFLWAGFAIFWNMSVWNTDTDMSFKLFGLPFLIVGLYVTVGRFLIDAYIRKRMLYSVTNRRVLIARTGRKNTKSLDVKRLPALEFDERSDGSGAIRFGNSRNWLSGTNFGIWQPTFDATPQFIRIPNVRAIYELIQKQSDN